MRSLPNWSLIEWNHPVLLSLRLLLVLPLLTEALSAALRGKNLVYSTEASG